MTPMLSIKKVRRMLSFVYACALLDLYNTIRRCHLVQAPFSIKSQSVILAMASTGYYQTVVILLAAQLLLCYGATDADQETGTVIPAESRPCVDCHAFEFMQRALQDLKKTAFNLDARTETLVLRAERRALCDCMPTNSLR